MADSDQALVRHAEAVRAIVRTDPAFWQLVQRTVAKGATPDEFAMFREVALREGLDPLTKQIHFVKRHRAGCDSKKRVEPELPCSCEGDISFVVGVHGLVARCNREARFGGIQSAAVGKNDHFRCDPVAALVEHTFTADRGPIIGAWARGRVGERAPVLRHVSIDEYRGESPLWRSKPATMIEKVAIVQCARALLPEQLAGLYAAEEMGGETHGNAVFLPLPSGSPDDPDARQIAAACEIIAGVTEAADLDAVLPAIRAEAETWTPAAKRLFKSRLETRRAELS